MKWSKIDRTVNSEGTTITYAAEGLNRIILIQSRRRHIPHANGIGTWDHTTYHIIAAGMEAPSYYRTLGEAKEAAEILAEALYGRLQR